MHGSMGGERRPATVGHAARRQAPLAYPTNLVPELHSTRRRKEALLSGTIQVTGHLRSPSEPQFCGRLYIRYIIEHSK